MLLDHATRRPLAFTHLWWVIKLYHLNPPPSLLSVLSSTLCPLSLLQLDEPGPRGDRVGVDTGVADREGLSLFLHNNLYRLETTFLPHFHGGSL